MSENENNFAAALKKARGDKSQAEFAVLLGIPQQSYSRYEAGRIPKLEILHKIGLKLGLSVSDLLGWPPRSDTVHYQKHSLMLESVVDSIPGLTPEQQQQVFERLFMFIQPPLPNRRALEKIIEIEAALAELKKLVEKPVGVQTEPIKPS